MATKRKTKESVAYENAFNDVLALQKIGRQIFDKKLQESKDESSNLELALQKSIDTNQKLRDEIDQLKDNLEKYTELYASTKIIAQALGEAVYFLTKEKQHG
jgi:septal ring factor EnvC (AmiA/AmiB activator)